MDSHQVGETVRLRSGGPPMTVRGFNQETTICQWFTSGGETKVETFPTAGLVRVDQSDRGATGFERG